jgi:hypothetical protein
MATAGIASLHIIVRANRPPYAEEANHSSRN